MENIPPKSLRWLAGRSTMNESMYFLNYWTWGFSSQSCSFSGVYPPTVRIFPWNGNCPWFQGITPPGNSRDGTIQNEASYWKKKRGFFFLCIYNLYGCFLTWWDHQNTPKWSFLVEKPMVVGYHHFRKPPYMWNFRVCVFQACLVFMRSICQTCVSSISHLKSTNRSSPHSKLQEPSSPAEACGKGHHANTSKHADGLYWHEVISFQQEL